MANFSNSWQCEVSQQTGETDQVTASESSVFATHWTMKNTWIFLMPLIETTMMVHHREA